VVQRLEEARIKAVPTGIDHGTITAVSDGHPFEITTLRRDVSTDARRATVSFTDDWQEYAARRDYTIKALSADPVTGELVDDYGGLTDLEQRHIRFIGDPYQRIAEEYLRILRFFRFHARFGSGALDPAALEACTARAKDLMALSRERIADEVLKLLGMDDPCPALAIMLDRDILQSVLPEIAAERIATLRALIAAEREAGIEPDSLRRLTALLPRQSATAEDVAARLRLSNKARKRIGCSADPNIAGDPRALAYRVGVQCTVDRLLLGDRPRDAAAIARWHPPRLPIGGGALIKRGLSEGPIVAQTLRRIEDRWVEAGFPTESALEEIIETSLAEANL
jgi:poly(A) polymerase